MNKGPGATFTSILILFSLPFLLGKLYYTHNTQYTSLPQAER